jgi:hypothetical protein
MKPMVKLPEHTRLKLQYGEPLSNFAFNFNSRRYIVGLRESGATEVPQEVWALGKVAWGGAHYRGSRCPI